MVLVLAATVLVSAGDPTGDAIEVDGVFHGDPTGAGDPDSNHYIKLGENPGRGTLYYYRNGTTLYLAVVVDPMNVNDMVFGEIKGDVDYLQSAGWSGSANERSAKHLINSDNVTMRLTCNNLPTWEWSQDYAYLSGSRYLSGPAGDDGAGSSPGGANDVFASSGTWNFNRDPNGLTGAKWDYTAGKGRPG